MHSVTLFVQISKHSSKLGQMEVELVSLKFAQVAFGAKKSKMVLFCRKSGKLDLQRKRVATTAKAGKESDDEEHARLLPNDTRNPDRGQRGLQRKKTCILILDQGREKAYKSIGEVAKSPEEPELESEESKLLAR